MDEKKMLDEIRRSADSIEAPESLRPELIEDELQGRSQRKRWTGVYRWGMMAAVLLIALVAAWQINQAQIKNITPGEGVKVSVKEETEAPMQTEASAPESKESGAKEAGEDEAIPHVEDEEELYAALHDMTNMADGADRGIGGELESTTEVGVDMEEGAAAAEDSLSMDTAAKESMNTSAQEGDFSQTNLQEIGVDEGDIVKTDGDYLYILSGQAVYIVRADGGNMTLTGKLTPPALDEEVQEMYLDGDLLCLITTNQLVATITSAEEDMARKEEVADVLHVDEKSFTKVYTWNIKNRENPVLLGVTTQEGYYATSRRNGDLLYLFTSYTPKIRQTREESSLLPEAGGEVMEISDVYLPEYAADSSYLVISSMNLRQPGALISRKAVVSGTGNYYVSTENIYIATWQYDNNRAYTQILKFSYQDGIIRPVGVSNIRGEINDSFSLNESNGYLRVVATDWSGKTEVTRLYVLDEGMQICGKIDDLAPGESVRSARFLGDTGYFVTFRQTDPLFSVDLSDPRNPRILGELKVTGFSSYLHFYGENLLLGLGQEVDPDSGRYQGIKLSMFDISNPADVKEVGRYVLDKKYDCPGIYNYKAILADPGKNLIGFECDGEYYVFSWQEGEGFVLDFKKERSGEEDVCYSQEQRGLYIGRTFYLTKNFGSYQIEAYDMDNGFQMTGDLSYRE